MAGIEAIADEVFGRPHGFANPAIYALDGRTGINDVVNPAGKVADVRNDFLNAVDATAGITTSLRTFNHDSSLKVTAGWDDVTGVGTPNGIAYLRQLGS